MDKTFERIIERLEEHERTHKRVDIGKERRRSIREHYQRLKAIEVGAQMGVRYDERSLYIRIMSQHLVTCSDAPALSVLIGLCDVCFIDRCRDGFIIDLGFNLWRWVKKEEGRDTP